MLRVRVIKVVIMFSIYRCWFEKSWTTISSLPSSLPSSLSYLLSPIYSLLSTFYFLLSFPLPVSYSPPSTLFLSKLSPFPHASSSISLNSCVPLFLFWLLSLPSPPLSKARKSNQQKKDHWSFFCARKGPWSFFCYYMFIRLQVSVKYKKYMGISAVKCLLILYTYPAYFAETLLYKAPLLIQRTRGNPRTMLIQWHTIKTFMYI